MRMSDWISDVCSSDLERLEGIEVRRVGAMRVRVALLRQPAARVVVVVTRPALGHEGPDVRQQRGNEDAPVGDGHAVSPGGGGVAANTTQIGRDRKRTRLNSSH